MRKLKKGRARRLREKRRRRMYVPSVHEMRFYAAANVLFAQIADDWVFGAGP